MPRTTEQEARDRIDAQLADRLGEARQLLGNDLPRLLDELNETLPA